MTNTKKLSDYTVSDIEKILREDLSDNEMVQCWNNIFYYLEKQSSAIRCPNEIDEYLTSSLPTDVISRLGDHFSLSDKYMTYDDEGKFVTFNKLDDKYNPIDYEQCASVILKDKALLNELIMHLYGLV